MTHGTKKETQPKAFDPKGIELTLIGFVFAYPERFYEVQELSEALFLDPARRLAWATMRQTYERDGAPGLQAKATVVAVLARAGLAEDISVAMMTEALDYAPRSPDAILPTKKEIQHLGLKRAISVAGREISGLAEHEEDSDQLAQAAGIALAEALRTGSSVRVRSLSDEMQREIDEMEAIDRGEIHDFMGLRTGLTSLDHLTCGMHAGESVILGARPSMGKSSLANHLAVEFAAGQKVPGVVISLEMRAQEWSQRIICSKSACDLQKARHRLLNPSERERYVSWARKLRTAPLYIQDDGGLTLSRISTTIRRLYYEHGVRWAIIDYLQLIDHGKRGGESDNSAISRTSQGIKAMALNLDIPIVTLSQLNRDCERRDNKRPKLSDLRDSGSIEQDADVVMFLYRESAYYTEEQKEEHRHDKESPAEIIIAKQRNGPIGTARVSFQNACASFGDLPDGFEAAGSNRTHRYS